MAVAFGFSAASCRPPTLPETATPTIATLTPSVLPDLCSNPAELMRPPGLSRESVSTYSNWIVVNQAGSLIRNVTVNPIHLQRLDDDPDLGLTLPGHIKIIYFFAGSLYRPDLQEQMHSFFSTHRLYLLARYCQEQGRPARNLLIVGLSVADALAEIKSRDADELARVLAENYIQGTRILIGDPIGRIPRELPQEILDRTLSEGLPFRVAGWYNNLNESSSGA